MPSQNETAKREVVKDLEHCSNTVYFGLLCVCGKPSSTITTTATVNVDGTVKRIFCGKRESWNGIRVTRMRQIISLLHCYILCKTEGIFLDEGSSKF